MYYFSAPLDTCDEDEIIDKKIEDTIVDEVNVVKGKLKEKANDATPIILISNSYHL